MAFDKAPAPPCPEQANRKYWDTERCDLTLEQLVQFGRLMRIVVVDLVYADCRNQKPLYEDVLQYMESKIIPILRAQGDSDERRKDLRDAPYDLRRLLVRNLARCIPNLETLSMLQDFHNKLEARQQELKNPLHKPQKLN